jgi:hypothetical protein
MWDYYQARTVNRMPRDALNVAEYSSVMNNQLGTR